jgi:hypothetical protein
MECGDGGAFQPSCENLISLEDWLLSAPEDETLSGAYQKIRYLLERVEHLERELQWITLNARPKMSPLLSPSKRRKLLRKKIRR